MSDASPPCQNSLERRGGGSSSAFVRSAAGLVTLALLTAATAQALEVTDAHAPQTGRKGDAPAVALADALLVPSLPTVRTVPEFPVDTSGTHRQGSRTRRDMRPQVLPIEAGGPPHCVTFCQRACAHPVKLLPYAPSAAAAQAREPAPAPPVEVEWAHADGDELTLEAPLNALFRHDDAHVAEAGGDAVVTTDTEEFQETEPHQPERKTFEHTENTQTYARTQENSHKDDDEKRETDGEVATENTVVSTTTTATATTSITTFDDKGNPATTPTIARLPVAPSITKDRRRHRRGASPTRLDDYDLLMMERRPALDGAREARSYLRHQQHFHKRLAPKPSTTTTDATPLVDMRRVTRDGASISVVAMPAHPVPEDDARACVCACADLAQDAPRIPLAQRTRAASPEGNGMAIQLDVPRPIILKAPAPPVRAKTLPADNQIHDTDTEYDDGDEEEEITTMADEHPRVVSAWVGNFPTHMDNAKLKFTMITAFGVSLFSLFVAVLLING